MQCKDKHTFEVGDYIGDINGTTWIVDSVSEDKYVISNIPHKESVFKKTKTLNRVEVSEWSRNRNYDVEEGYHILRPKDHEDVVNYPIGSKWSCNKDCGLHNKKKDIVTIYSYAYDKGLFWVESTGCRGVGFLADADELKPLPKDKSNTLFTSDKGENYEEEKTARYY